MWNQFNCKGKNKNLYSQRNIRFFMGFTIGNYNIFAPIYIPIIVIFVSATLCFYIIMLKNLQIPTSFEN